MEFNCLTSTQMEIDNLLLKNNVLLAPMAGITDLIFRLLAREFGCSLCFTEMISANGLVMETGKSYQYLESVPDDSPLGVQIFGSDPNVLSEAARIVTDKGADLVDINMGCPVKKILRTGAGGALMRDHSKIASILKSVRKATSLPLTVKMRSGWSHDEINVLNIARVVQDCGADAVVLHPRTVNQGFGGRADWSHIASVKRSLDIPVVGSGDIRGPEDARNMLDVTGCDGVMIGRGVLGNPWIIRDVVGYLENKNIFSLPDLKEREYIINRHLDISVSFFGKKAGLKKFRKHLLWYTKGLKESSRFREIIVRIDEKELLIDMIHSYFESIDEKQINVQCDSKQK